VSLLELRGVEVTYGDLPALRGVTVSVEAGETLSVVGANGAGKTTMLRTISGLMRPRAGEIRLDGARLDQLPSHAIVEHGVVQVPEGRKIFPSLSVLENLEMGSYIRSAKTRRREGLEQVFGLFPRLAERRRQAAGTMSGGEQQMLAIGRALMGAPILLLLDEPSVGIAQRLKVEIFNAIRTIQRAGTAVLLVEQDAHSTLAIAEQIYVLEHGRVVREGTARTLAVDDEIRRIYLGV